MKFSVVTPVKNSERFLAQTIESVLNQKGNFELEYVIRDGGSTDRSLEIARSYASQDSRITVQSEEDRSMYDAINKGFTSATGDIGCWINADDFYEPNAFQQVVEFFSSHPEIQWAYGDCDIIDEENQERREAITFYKQLIGYRYSYWMLLCENYVNQPATFWKMDLWKKIGGASLDFKISEDYHIWLKMAQHSPAKRIPQLLAHFRRYGNSISDQNFEKQFEEQLQIVNEYAGPITKLIHRFNCWKIVTTYRLLS